MAASPSWSSRASSSRRDRSSLSNYELPRWHSPSPMAASMIPPPIVESAYLSPPSSAAKSIIVEKPSPAESKESELQADLQFLLDAQAEGLIRGLEGGLVDDTVSTGSTTPTARSVRSSVARQVNKPVRRKLGLRSARKGIYNSIVALSAIKDERLQAIERDVAKREQNLGRIDAWENKRKGLQEAASSVDTSEETIRVQRLRQEADTMQEEINSVEMQLADMKTRHNKILRQAAAAENAIQAKLASYTSSMSMLEADIQKFLSLQSREARSRPSSSDGQTSVWRLPPKSRTLDMAKDTIVEEREVIQQQRQSVELEKQALDEGAVIWREVVALVTELEKRLRSETASLSPAMSDSTTAWDDAPHSSPADRLKELLEKMATVIEDVESRFTIAKERNWNLLIAAIGAELDALKQGKLILEGVLGVAAGNNDLINATDDKEDLVADAGGEIHELDEGFQTSTHDAANSSRSDMDDEPDPELMFSRQDTDTE